MQEVFPPYRAVVGPGFAIEPRVPQNCTRTFVSTPSAQRSQVPRESVTQHNLGNSKAFQSEQKRRATYRSSGCSRNTRSRSRYWQRHSTRGINWNQIASRVFNEIHRGLEFNRACFCDRPQYSGVMANRLVPEESTEEACFPMGTEHRTLDLALSNLAPLGRKPCLRGVGSARLLCISAMHSSHDVDH